MSRHTDWKAAGQLLTEWRERPGVDESQASLAMRAKVSVSTISRLENADPADPPSPKPKTLMKLASLMDLGTATRFLEYTGQADRIPHLGTSEQQAGPPTSSGEGMPPEEARRVERMLEEFGERLARLEERDQEK